MKEMSLFYEEMDALKTERENIKRSIVQTGNNLEKEKKLEEITERMINKIGLREWTNFLYYKIDGN